MTPPPFKKRQPHLFLKRVCACAYLRCPTPPLAADGGVEHLTLVVLTLVLELGPPIVTHTNTPPSPHTHTPSVSPRGALARAHVPWPLKLERASRNTVPPPWPDVLAEMSRHIYIRNKIGEGIQAPIFQVGATLKYIFCVLMLI